MDDKIIEAANSLSDAMDALEMVLQAMTEQDESFDAVYQASAHAENAFYLIEPLATAASFEKNKVTNCWEAIKAYLRFCKRQGMSYESIRQPDAKLSELKGEMWILRDAESTLAKVGSATGFCLLDPDDVEGDEWKHNSRDDT